MGDEDAIIATNDDASECKRGAVELGYWRDDFLTHFAQRRIERRPPEINRGYFARVSAIDAIVGRFLARVANDSGASVATAQIVNLGAGYDTLYWRLRQRGIQLAKYVELDFPAVTARKCTAVKRTRQLLEYVHGGAEDDGEVRLSATDLHATTYHCVGCDLRSVGQVEASLKAAELSFSRPTLFIAECVLVYLEADSCERLLAWIAHQFPHALFVSYEMCNMEDTFGDVMLENLRTRGCTLAGVAACLSLDAQKARFTHAHWGGANAWDMVQVYYGLAAGERVRIERIEFLDEQELLMQLFQHYCVTIAWTGAQFADVPCTPL